MSAEVSESGSVSTGNFRQNTTFNMYDRKDVKIIFGGRDMILWGKHEGYYRFHLHLIKLVTYFFAKMLIPFVIGICCCFCRRNMLIEELPTTDALDSLPFENYEGYDLVSAQLYGTKILFAINRLICSKLIEWSEKIEPWLIGFRNTRIFYLGMSKNVTSGGKLMLYCVTEFFLWHETVLKWFFPKGKWSLLRECPWLHAGPRG